MRIRFRYVILICSIILLFFTVRKVIITAGNAKLVNSSIRTISHVYDLRVIKADNELKHGEIGTITIQGKPRVTYTIIAAYSKGNKALEAKQQRTADEFGQATFIWTVSKETVPGTYLVTITGGGRSLELNHTVVDY
jgi:hypothetical protein